MFIIDYSIKILFLSFYCFTINNLYSKLYYALDHIDKNNKLSESNKLYITKNIVKSIVLLIITLFSPVIIYNIWYYQYWNNTLLNHVGSIYVSNDIMGLLRVKKLHLTTKIHHLTTTSLLLYSFYIDFNQNKIGQLIFMYCIFSCYTFLVNFYLGIRFFKDHRIIKLYIETIRISALNTYVFFCMVNWMLQVIYIVNFLFMGEIVTQIFVYVSILIPIIIDDIKLIKWLYQKKNIEI